jgi:hypothetical protein
VFSWLFEIVAFSSALVSFAVLSFVQNLNEPCIQIN